MINQPTSQKRPTRRQFLQAAASTLPWLTLSGCGWRLANVSPAAGSQNDGNLLYIYTWSGYTDQDLLDRFEAETGIRAIADVYDSNEAMLARLQAGGGGAYSIIYPSEYMVQKMINMGMLLELEQSRIEGIYRLFSRFQEADYDPGNRHSVPVSWGTTGLIYNTQQVQPPPEDWDYLWVYQQQLAKRMTLLNDVREVMGAALKMLGYSYNSTNMEHIQAAYQALMDLKRAIASFTSDAWRPQILSGDLKIAMCYSSDATEIMPENEDLRYVLPESGSSLWIDTLAIPKTAPNIDGAYAWINFMLQPDVAARIVERLSFATPNKAAYNLLPPELKNNASLFPPEEALERCENLEPLEEVEAVYERYWTKLTSS
ncbi:ABC transporter substrate-binding protein [Coleofasciculus sp. G2-EDA-02]|uniref:ABC transporter substrate-binding protein n=1 Tax=Coleofasciculus sp. G2-EDA-02 TaxID=3069529 RepID=UPI0032FD3736